MTGAKRPSVKIAVKREPEGVGLPLPGYMTEHAAGMDLLAACESSLILKPGRREAVSTGISIALPPGWEAQVRPRSGLALRHGLTLLNTPGTVDADYRGPIKVILVNLGQEDVVIRRGDRIAQLIIAPVSVAVWEEVTELPETPRGSGGFGHTGR